MSFYFFIKRKTCLSSFKSFSHFCCYPLYKHSLNHYIPQSTKASKCKAIPCISSGGTSIASPLGKVENQIP